MYLAFLIVKLNWLTHPMYSMLSGHTNTGITQLTQ